MQEYDKRTKNGNAGEYLAAYKFTKIFGWPYRMLDVDIGVDAEFEILDDNGVSTSDLIKVQIKTFDKITSEGSKKVYVSSKHINYWKNFCLPVIVLCIDLESEEIYWKSVVATEIYESGGESNVISIDLLKDKLVKESRDKFLALVSPESSKNIATLLAVVRQQHDALLKHEMLAIDGKQLTDVEDRYEEINLKISQIEEIIRYFPWRAGVLTLREIAIIRRNAEIKRNDASRSFAVSVNGM